MKTLRLSFTMFLLLLLICTLKILLVDQNLLKHRGRIRVTENSMGALPRTQLNTNFQGHETANTNTETTTGALTRTPQEAPVTQNSTGTLPTNTSFHGNQTTNTHTATDEQIIELQQKDRKWRLNEYCKSHNKNSNKAFNKNDLRFIIVNDKYKTLYCFIPKVACTQWKTILFALTNRTRGNKSDIHDRGLLKLLSQYSNAEIQVRRKTYFKFLFVREPLERLLSAYESKFATVNTNYDKKFFLQFAKDIVMSHKRENPRADNSMTFPKFISYIAGGKGFEKEPHWTTYQSLCNPCALEYDFIGHFEDMPREAPYVLRQTGMDRDVTFPQFHSHNTSIKLLKQYSEVPRSKIIELGKAFQKDFEMFDYPFPGPLAGLLRDFH